MLKEADFGEYSNRDLLTLRDANYGEFFRLRQRLIKEECMLDDEANKPITDTLEPNPRKTLESYDGYSLKTHEEWPLLAKIYSSFKSGIKKVAPLLIGGGFFGGMTAWMAFSSGGPVYLDAIIISSGIGGVIGHKMVNHGRVIEEKERANKLILSTYETL